MPEFLNPRNNSMPENGLNPGASANGFVFAGGMALNHTTLKRLDEADTIANETRLCLEEIEEILQAKGCTRRDIVKTTCYVSDDAYRWEFMKAYTEFFAPGPYPARATFQVGIACGCRVEIDAIAAIPESVK